MNLSLAAVLIVGAPQLSCPDMVLVAGGEFHMGCNPRVDEHCAPDERPGRKVHVDPFCIDRTEVTVRAYKKCVSAGGCTSEGMNGFEWEGQPHTPSGFCHWGRSGRDDHPINCVAWEQADAYCRWAGKSLPTEAQWEKAARGEDGRRFPWGNEMSSCDRAVMDMGCGRQGTRLPCSKEGGESPYGLCDMSGNVWEWVADFYAKRYYASAPAKNPPGPKSGTHRVFRGAGWRHRRPPGLRTSARYHRLPTARYGGGGFRCVMIPGEEEQAP